MTQREPDPDSDYVFVDSREGLERAARALSSCPSLYLDTEFESGRGPTRLCLLQISSGSEIFLIDTVKLGKLEPLVEALARPEVQWVLHAGLQDLALLEERLQLRAPQKLFDTQVAHALLSAENNVSLAYLQYVLLGVRSDKGHRTDDWLRRPLPEAQLRYAASDVRYLPELTRILTERADAKARLELVYEASHEALEPSRESAAPLTLDSFRNAWQLGERSQAGLRFIIDWYNGLGAEDRANAPDTKTLLALAGRMPENMDVLTRIKGVSPGFARRQGERILRGLAQAAQRARSSDFVPIEPPPYATFDEARCEAWLGLLRAEVCAELEVSPEHVLPARLMRELKAGLQRDRSMRISDALRGYRRRLLGTAIERFCEQTPPPRIERSQQ